MQKPATGDDSLFARQIRPGVRALVTGQVGLDKKPLLQRVVELARTRDTTVALANIGDIMYDEAPDVVRGRILDLPLGRLATLRRAAFKDVQRLADRHENLVVNSHATFRWRHGLFQGFDHDQMKELDADLYVTLVDNVDAIHERLERDHHLRHTLKDILVWREEEVLATEILANSLRGFGHFFVLARGDEDTAVESLYRLMFEHHRKRVYPSFPMTHVMDQPDVLAEIDAFRDQLAEHFITFDPGDLDEKRLLIDARKAAAEGRDSITLPVNGRDVAFKVTEIANVDTDIDGQIYARDFKLIDQSDMIVSFIPALPSGRPAISSGVERELQHAYEATKEVYVIWQPKAEPSPFITMTATRVFSSVTEALEFFQQRGYLTEFQLSLPAAGAPRKRGRFG
jgi:adenylate kinase